MPSEVIADNSPQYKSFQAAYNPIISYVTVYSSGGQPPVVYCDVYFNHFFYKTLSSTTPALVSGGISFWRFDISGLAQEFIKSRVPFIGWPGPGGSGIENLYRVPPFLPPPADAYGCTRAFMKFRVSSADAYGVITPEGPEPVQGTIDSYPVEGGGWATDNFQIINAAMQWSNDRMDMEGLLNDYRRQGTFSSVFYEVDPHYLIYPLSKMKRGTVYATDYGQLPFIIKRDGFYSPLFVGGVYSFPAYRPAAYVSIAVEIYDRTGVRIHAQPSGAILLESESIYNLPIGVKNIIDLFPTSAPFFKSCYFYQMFIYDPEWALAGYGERCMFVSPRMYLQQAENAQPAEHTRIWFKNYLGHLDALNFRVREESLKVTSSPFERPQLDIKDARQLVGIGRNNVRSNETNEVSEVFLEEELPLIKELMSTGQAYIEMLVPDADQFSPFYQTQLLPITIIDADYATYRHEDRYEYQVNVKYTMSNENRIIRN